MAVSICSAPFMDSVICVACSVTVRAFETTASAVNWETLQPDNSAAVWMS